MGEQQDDRPWAEPSVPPYDALTAGGRLDPGQAGDQNQGHEHQVGTDQAGQPASASPLPPGASGCPGTRPHSQGDGNAEPHGDEPGRRADDPPCQPPACVLRWSRMLPESSAVARRAAVSKGRSSS